MSFTRKSVCGQPKNTVEKQQRRLCNLIEQHNGLQHMLRLRESQLLEMEQTMKSLEMDSNPDGDERQYDQARQNVALTNSCNDTERQQR